MRSARGYQHQFKKEPSAGLVGCNSGNARLPGNTLVVIGEVAVSLLLLAGAGMLVHSLSNLRDVNPGFNQDKVLLVAIDPTLVGYRGDRLLNLYKDLPDAVAMLPGVRSVGLSAVPPMSRRQWRTGVFVQGHTPGPNEDTTTRWNLIGPNFFRTLQIPLLQGRDFIPQDDSTAPRVAIINQAMARFYFGTRPSGEQRRPRHPRSPYLGSLHDCWSKDCALQL